MKTRNRTLISLAGTSLLVSGVAMTVAQMPTAHAGPFGNYADDAARSQQAQRQNVSIWVDANWGFRKRGAANELNQAHEAYAAHGFEVLDVDPYIENGDLQGFFVTYRKR